MSVLAPVYGDLSFDAMSTGFSLSGLSEIRRDPLRYFLGLMHAHGDVVWFNVGLHRVLMLSHPGAVKHVFSDNWENYHKSRFYEPLRPILGNGIFLSHGKEWKRQRQQASPAFNGMHFTEMATKISSVMAATLDRWEHHCERGEPINLTAEMTRVTLDSATQCLLNVELQGQHAAMHEALTVLLREAERSVWRIIPRPTSLTLATNRIYREALRTLDEITWSIINERRHNPQHPEDLLSRLIASADNGESDHKLLRDQVLSILLSGHDTTAIALSWTWMLLSKHPFVRQQMHDEIDTVLARRQPTFSNLKDLRYTTMIFEEALRLYPPVWTLSRTAMVDDRVDGVEIPAGTTVMVSPYVVHRHPRYWPNPEGFDPGRFGPGQELTRPAFAHIPFGGGPRVCLGKRFAMMEAALILSMAGQKFELSMIAGQREAPEPMITLRPSNGMWMTLKRRPQVANAEA